MRFTALLALAGGGLSAYAFAPFGLWPLAPLGIALLAWLLWRAETHRGAFLIGWLFALGQFSVGLNWIAKAFTYQDAMPHWLGYLAVVLLSLYLAVWPGAAALLARFAGRDRPLPFVLALAGAWTLAEWTRGWAFTGFPWNPLSSALIAEPDMARAAALVGTYGLSGIVALVGGLIWWGWERRALVPGAAALTLLGLLWGGGAAWRGAHPLPARGTAITIVQPNIGQEYRNDPAYDRVHFGSLAKLSLPEAPARPRLLLWPEGASYDYLESGYPARFYAYNQGGSAVAARMATAALLGPDDLLLTGGTRLFFDPARRLTGAGNSVMALTPDARIVASYDKAHLVPYGEYLPARPLLSALGLSRLVPGSVDFIPGPGTQTLDLGPAFGKAGMLICYEVIFSGQVTDRARRPDWLFNPSNDAWYGAWGPPQHLAQARLRAIEEGLPMLRATPTGISAAIDAHGSVVAALPLGRAGRIDSALPTPLAATPFARLGNVIPVTLALLLLIAAIAFGRRAR